MSEEKTGKPDWLDMIPIKRYRHFTRFFRPVGNGDGYSVCIPNSEIEFYEIKEEENKRMRTNYGRTGFSKAWRHNRSH